MCGGGSQKVKQEVKLPWYQEATGKELYNRGTAEASKPYTAYGGTRVAPLTSEQNAAYDMTLGNVNSWEPYFNQAESNTAAGGQSWIDPGVMDSYIDPFQSAVTERAANEMRRNFDMQEKLRRGRAAETGSWGSSQAGVADANAQRDFNLQLEDLYSTGLEKAYQSGLSAFQSDRDAKQRTGGAYANLAQLFPSLQRNDAAAIEYVGNAKQGQQQKELDQDYQDFIEGRDWNKNQLSWLASLMNQTPAPTSTTQSGGGTSTAGQVLGGTQSLAGLGLLSYLALSDRRLKTDIEKIGDDGRLGVYRFRYRGDDSGREFIGYMADEVREVAPWAVVRVGGYDAVNYGAM